MNKNYVVEGKYKNRKILGGSSLDIDVELQPLNKRYISSYTVIDESNKDQYSFWKGALGVALFGGLGVIAGVTAENGVPYLRFPMLESESFIEHGFSTRKGGVSTGIYESMNLT